MNVAVGSSVVGVPESTPVVGSNVSPAGAAGDSEKPVGASPPERVGVLLGIASSTRYEGFGAE